MASDTGAAVYCYHGSISSSSGFSFSVYEATLTKSVTGFGGSWTGEMKRFEITVRRLGTRPSRHG
jgi:hypothetical protein